MQPTDVTIVDSASPTRERVAEQPTSVQHLTRPLSLPSLLPLSGLSEHVTSRERSSTNESMRRAILSQSIRDARQAREGASGGRFAGLSHGGVGVVAMGSAAPSSSTVLSSPPQDRINGLHVFPELSAETTEAMAKADNADVARADPRHGNDFVAHKQPSGLSAAYHMLRSLYLQLALFALYVIGVVLVIVQIVRSNGGTRWLTTFAMLLYVAEMLIFVGYMGLARFQLDQRCWRIAEPVIVLAACVLEFAAWQLWNATHHYPSRVYTGLGWVRLLLWAVHGMTRWEQLTLALRRFCSCDRRRYEADGCDLDLAYIHRNVIAMAWPAGNFERLFRNPAEQVAALLDKKHRNAYLVVNLCSERTYHPSCFHQQTSWCPMDDHNPAELESTLDFCREAGAFILADPDNRVLVLHCKGGKGRTGVMVCALLMYLGLNRTANRALDHFARLRTTYGRSTFQGVQTPSQARYVHYVERALQLPQLRLPRRVVRVRSMWLYNVPWVWYAYGIGRLWFAIVLKPCSERHIAFLSNATVQFDAQVPDPSTYTAKQLRDLFNVDDERTFYEEANVMDERETERVVVADEEEELIDVNASASNTAHRDSTDVDTSNNSGGNARGVKKPTTTMESAASSNSAAAVPIYASDTESFWYYVNDDFATRMSYGDFRAYLRRHAVVPGNTRTSGAARRGKAAEVPELKVSLELRHPERLPLLEDDVVFKFFYARNNPNPLEPPVQFWFHTAFETKTSFRLGRDELDGPSKDKTGQRYPAEFAIELRMEPAEVGDEPRHVKLDGPLEDREEPV